MYRFNKGDRVIYVDTDKWACVDTNLFISMGSTGKVAENNSRYPMVHWDNGLKWPVHQDKIEIIKEGEMKKEIELIPVVDVWIDDDGVPMIRLPRGYEEHWPWISIAGRIVAAYPECKYIAVDKDGECYGYDLNPEIRSNMFADNHGNEFLMKLVNIPEQFRAPDWRTTRFEVRHV